MRKKIWLALASGIFLFLAAFVRVSASENGTFLEGYRVEEGMLRIYCSDIAPEEETADGCKVSLGGQDLTVISVESEKERHTPVTYYCLADVSGSMGQEQMAQVRGTLLAVVSGMRDGDNMAVGTLGNQTAASGFLTDKKELEKMVGELEAGKEDTNLYAGIVEGIRALQADTSVNPRKCLIVLSDGEDDQKKGITKTEAEETVKESSIPVYTVATLKDAADEDGISNAKLLGSFARISTGGMHFAPVLENSTGEQAGQSILFRMEEGFAVNVELPEKAPDKDVLLLRMLYTSTDQTVYEDTLEIYAEDLGMAAEKEESDPVPDPTPEPIPEPVPEPIPGPAPWRIAGAVPFFLMVLGIVFFVRKKKISQKCGNAETGGPEEISNTGKRDGLGNSLELGTRGKTSPQTAPAPLEFYELHLRAIGYTEVAHTIRIEQGKEVTVGRNRQADIVLDREDKKLSGVHCRMQWDGEKLYVWDMNSTNGTFVNGISIKSMGRVAVREGETIRMGSYEYRVGSREEK